MVMLSEGLVRAAPASDMRPSGPSFTSSSAPRLERKR
jgi:hypothetical protein